MIQVNVINNHWKQKKIWVNFTYTVNFIIIMTLFLSVDRFSQTIHVVDEQCCIGEEFSHFQKSGKLHQETNIHKRLLDKLSINEVNLRG